MTALSACGMPWYRCTQARPSQGHDVWWGHIVLRLVQMGTHLQVGAGDDTIRLWDVVTGAHKQVLTGHTDSVYSVAFSPDGNTLASGSSDGTIRLWGAVTGAHKQILDKHRSGITSVSV